MNLDFNMEMAGIAGEKPKAYLDCFRTSKNVARKDGSRGKLAKESSDTARAETGYVDFAGMNKNWLLVYIKQGMI